MNRGYASYRISKTALNAVTKLLSEELAPDGILINSVCPGWVKTDMGGEGAHREVPEGASGITWAATLPQGGPTGGFYRDGKSLSW
jgi:NAD(P)-dependent dehydrogenase (short-subunit alcohol dehydrogenase family)